MSNNNKNKKMKLFPSIFKKPSSQWLPSCNQPKTLSFRHTDKNDDVYKTVNSVFLDIESPESIFTPSSHSLSFSTEELSQETNLINNDTSVDNIIQQIQQSSNRLFFEPRDTSSILIKEAPITKPEHNEQLVLAPFKESVALAMESDDPYSDFKKSMAEMVESHGLKDWDCLEELLGWYLKMNGKVNHGFIVGAFVDLLVGIDEQDQNSCSFKGQKMQFTHTESINTIKSCVSNTNTTSNVTSSISTSYSSAASSLSSPPCSLVSCEIEIDQGDGGSCRY